MLKIRFQLVHGQTHIDFKQKWKSRKISESKIYGDSIKLNFTFDTLNIKKVRIFKSYSTNSQGDLYKELNTLNEFLDTLRRVSANIFQNYFDKY